MSVESTFEHVTDKFSENSLEATFHNGVLNIAVENPWAGSTESGFGYTCHIDMKTEDARRLGEWLLAVTSRKPDKGKRK